MCFVGVSVWKILQETVHFQNASSHTHPELRQQQVKLQLALIVTFTLIVRRCFSTFVCERIGEQTLHVSLQSGSSVSSVSTHVTTRSYCWTISCHIQVTSRLSVTTASTPPPKRTSWFPTWPSSTLVRFLLVLTDGACWNHLHSDYALPSFIGPLRLFWCFIHEQVYVIFVCFFNYPCCVFDCCCYYYHYQEVSACPYTNKGNVFKYHVWCWPLIIL